MYSANRVGWKVFFDFPFAYRMSATRFGQHQLSDLRAAYQTYVETTGDSYHPTFSYDMLGIIPECGKEYRITTSKPIDISVGMWGLHYSKTPENALNRSLLRLVVGEIPLMHRLYLCKIKTTDVSVLDFKDNAACVSLQILTRPVSIGGADYYKFVKTELWHLWEGESDTLTMQNDYRSHVLFTFRYFKDNYNTHDPLLRHYLQHELGQSYDQLFA